MKESQMYAPIKTFLESEGYLVRSEVQHADIVAVKEGKMIIVEMKTSFNLKLVYQLLERQRVSDDVYAAVRVTYKTRWGKAFQNMTRLLKRLGLGLIIVYEKKSGVTVEKMFDPELNRYNRSRIKEKRIKYEFDNRTGDHNTGGVTKEKIVTAYREAALKIACVLEDCDQMKLSEIRKVTGVEKAGTILQKNHYGWFGRPSRGHYVLNDKGRVEIKSFKSAYDRAKINDTESL